MRYDEYGDQVKKGKKGRWDSRVCKKTKKDHKYRLALKGSLTVEKCVFCGREKWNPFNLSEAKQKVIAIRKKRNITQEALANKIGVQQPAISRFENAWGHRDLSINFLERICAGLNLKLEINIEE